MNLYLDLAFGSGIMFWWPNLMTEVEVEDLLKMQPSEERIGRRMHGDVGGVEMELKNKGRLFVAWRGEGERERGRGL